MRLQPDAIAHARSRLHARQRADLGHQRQDDDGRDGRRRSCAAAGVALVHNQAGANMAGGVATTLLGAAGARGGIAGELGLFEVDELWLAAVADELAPRAILLGNLFRDQLDRYGELEAIAESWEEVLGARHTCPGPERRRPAASPTSAASTRRRSTSASRTTRSRCRAWPTPPTPSTAAAAARRTCSTPSTSATSATTTAPAAAAAARRPR